MATLKHSMTAPIASPQSEKKPGFLKRHLLHRRRSSATSFPNGIAPQQQQPTSSPRHNAPKQNTPSPQQRSSPQPPAPSQQSTLPIRTVSPPPDEPPQSPVREFPPLDSNGKRESVEVPPDVVPNANSEGSGTTEATDATLDPPLDPPRQNSRSSGVKFAPGVDLMSQTRTRRTSSTGTRRGSIFFRVQGSYIEGVDAGVGSKARRLSIAIPSELYVDECRLSEHFSVLARAHKKELGEGGAAVVRLMQSKTAGTAHNKDKLFAVKEFREWEPDEEMEREYVRKIKSEYAIAKSCQSPNIVETFRLCHDSNKKWYHVMEYCDLGDLNDLINRGYFSREDRNCMFKQLLRGVEYLHARGIAHRDLKSENLLLSHTGCLKIADFGTAEVFSGTHPGLKGCRRQSVIKDTDEIRLCAPGLVGSRPYMAPEIMKHEDMYDPRGVDVWSCAIVYLTLCIGGTPWECASVDVRNYNIFCSTWEAWLERYPDGIVKPPRALPQFANTKQFNMLDDMGTKYLVMGMLNPDPTKRWSAKDVLETPTVIDYPCCQQEGYSDDIKTRQRKAMHNHAPPKAAKGGKFLKPK